MKKEIGVELFECPLCGRTGTGPESERCPRDGEKCFPRLDISSVTVLELDKAVQDRTKLSTQDLKDIWEHIAEIYTTVKTRILQDECHHEWVYTETQRVNETPFGHKSCAKCGSLVPCEIPQD